MNPILLQYRGSRVNEIMPAIHPDYYDVEQSLAQRFERRQATRKRMERISELWSRLVSPDHRVHHLPRPLAHAHARPVIKLLRRSGK